MGQQQLLLIVLGVIIVGIAVVVGINLFNSSAKDAGRDQVISQLTNLASKAQQYYKKPTSLGGGNNAFAGFALAASEDSSSIGNFVVSSTAVTSTAAVTPGTTAATSAQEVWIVGSGFDNGNNGTDKVKAVTHVTPTNITTTVLN